MEAQFIGKKVLWPHLEEYLTVHKSEIETYIDLLKADTMDRATLETLLPKSFLLIHQTVTKIITENNISPIEEETKVDHLEFIVETVMKLLS
jgi:translation elongation factor EF-G